MKAFAYHHYGAADVLEPADITKPVPKPDEVLVRVHATSVTSGDYRARSLDMPPGFGLVGRLVFGLSRPRRKVLGTEFAGIVEAVGSKVTRFRPGDRVFAYPGASFGAYSEYVAINEAAAIAHAPHNLELDEAAAMSFGGATALNFLRDKGGIQTGDKLLIIGAAGCVGSAAVQIGKSFGAHVTGVCAPTHREMVVSLGADAVLDYCDDDPASARNAYDIILDTSGTATYSKYGSALKPGGRLLLVSANLWQLIGTLLARKAGGRKASGGYAPERAEDLRVLAELAKSGKFTPFIDRRFAFGDIPAAHRYFESREKKGNVVIVLDAD